jgi:hypothetical protein
MADQDKQNSAMSGAASGAAAGASFGPWGAVIGGGIGLLGGISSGKKKSKSEQMMEQIYAQYANLQIPETEKLRLALEQYQVQGTLDPSLEMPEQLGTQDNLENIQLDPRLEQARMQQLETLAKLGETSFTPSEQAQLNSMKRDVEADNQSRLKAMLQQQDMRGVGSSDAALASRMLESQSAANRQAEQTDNQAAMAFERALAAKSAAANVAQGIQGDEYNRESALANALNQREMVNMSQRSGAGQRNIDRFNDAQKTNLNNQQQVNMANTNLRNDQQAYNKNLEQRRYDNELKRLQGMQGINVVGAGEVGNQERAASGQRWASTGSGISNMINAFNTKK